MRLLGKVSIITGATSGIGEATAKLFAKEGSKVVLAGRNERRGNALAEEINKEGYEAIFVKTDVSSSTDVQNLINKTVEKWGKIDVLFNNAGIEIDGFVADYSEEDWDKVIDTNLKGAFLCSKYSFKQMIKQGTGGSIINNSSVLGIVSLPGCSAYSASKSGLIGLTRALALDGAPYKIRVNCLCPGFILTRLTEQYIDKKNPEKYLETVGRLHPIGRIGRPEEIAYAALFLASDESSFITGAVIPVDGGITATELEYVLTLYKLY